MKVEKIAFELFDATSDCTLQRMDSFAQAETQEKKVYCQKWECILGKEKLKTEIF